MTLKELESRIAKIRGCPLVLLCKTPDGQDKKMSVRECIETGSAFLHVCAGNNLDDLDELLAHELANAQVVEPKGQA